MQINKTQNSLNSLPKFNTSIAFRWQYSSISDDIKIRNEIVNSPVSSKSGNIKVKKGEVNSSISPMSGDIDISDSKVKGSISTLSGDLDISDSQIRGNISSKSGDLAVDSSTIVGDIESNAGKIKLKDSSVDGKIETSVENLKLTGKNTLKDLVLKDVKGNSINISKCNVYMSGSGSFGVISNGKLFVGGQSFGTINMNGKKIDLSKLEDAAEETAEAIEFKLSTGNKITGILQFDSKKTGTLLLEEDAEFAGKLINGTLKHIR